MQALLNIDPFVPTTQRHVRVRARTLPADTHFEPHRHPWAQLAYCSSGVLQVTVQTQREVTTIVPPSRAVWIPPDALHSVVVVEDAQFRTLYIAAASMPPIAHKNWAHSHVMAVSPLLRELVLALDEAPAPEREHSLAALITMEISAASTISLGVPMPPANSADRRLRALCEAVVHNMAAHKTLAQWAGAAGMSERTAARLFAQTLGLGFTQWRQQVALSHALPLLARGVAVGQVAPLCGYDSVSAFTAMFKAAMGHSPGYFSEKTGNVTVVTS